MGDTNRPGSEAKLTVGPLQCQGDSECRVEWSAFVFVCFFSLKEKWHRFVRLEEVIFQTDDVPTTLEFQMKLLDPE